MELSLVITEGINEGKKTSTNSVASIFAWTGALRKRGELDNTPAVIDYGIKLEKAIISTIESGKMTRDLIPLSNSNNKQELDTIQFMDVVQKQLNQYL